MREYLTRAGIIGKTNSTNVTFGDDRQNGLSKDLLGETFNGTWTVRILFYFDEGFLFSAHIFEFTKAQGIDAGLASAEKSREERQSGSSYFYQVRTGQQNWTKNWE